MYRLESEAIDDRRWITGVMILLYNIRWMPGWESWGVSSRSSRTSSTRVRMIWRYHIQIDIFRISNITHGHTNIRKKAFLIYWKHLSYKCKVGIKIPVKNVTPHCLQKIQTNNGRKYPVPIRLQSSCYHFHLMNPKPQLTSVCRYCIFLSEKRDVTNFGLLGVVIPVLDSKLFNYLLTLCRTANYSIIC